MTFVMLAELNPKLSWYAARASGLVAWAVVTLSILWGLALSTRLVRRKGVPAWLLDLHKFLGTLAVVFVVIHIAGLIGDNYVYFGARDLFVPMASRWRPGPVAWGIAATYLLVAIQVTSWLMRRIPRKLWHSVHLTSFLLFVSATVHGFSAGADSRDVAIQWVALTGSLAVLFLVLFRVLAPRRASRTARVPRSVAARAAPEAAPDATGARPVTPAIAALPDDSAETAAKVAALSEAVARVGGTARRAAHHPGAARHRTRI